MRDQMKSPHEAHRARVRARVRESGFDGMADHQVLEFLLFFSIPRKDTNVIAHRLIAAFGNLERVLKAPCEQLMAVEGVGEVTAVTLSSLSQLARRLAGSNCKRLRLENPEDVKSYLRQKYYGETQEVFYLLCFNRNGDLLQCARLSRGDAGTVVVDKRTMLYVALHCHADGVIFAHNHPNGVAAPSREDIQTTQEFSDALRSAGIRPIDHMIVADDDVFSLLSVPRFQTLFL